MADPIRVIELFAGIGAQASALERLGIPHIRVGVAEFEPHAYAAYCAIHGDTPNFGDITKIEHLPPCDLLTYSPPCQDISIAGNRKGLEEGSGTRSSLFWEVLRLLKDMKDRDCLPGVLQMENVDAIVNKQNRPHLERFIIALNELGYDSSWEVLNAKDFGIPQNRNRFYMISTLNKGTFLFPKGFPLEKRLKDVLDENVDESYYLRPEQIETYEAHRIRQIENNRGFGWHPKRLNGDTERERVANSVTTEGNRYASTFIIDDEPKSDGQGEPGLVLAGELGCTDYDQWNRVYDPSGVSPNLTTMDGGGRMPKIEVNNEKPNLVEAGILKCWETNAIMSKVYQADGISPTVLSGKNKNNAPKIEIAGTIDNGSVQNGIIDYQKNTNELHDSDELASAISNGNGTDSIPKIEKVGDLHLELQNSNGGRNNHANDVLGVNGISTCLTAAMGMGGGHVPKIEIAGKMADTNVEQAKRVYGTNGIAPTISAGGGTGSIAKIEVSKDD